MYKRQDLHHAAPTCTFGTLRKFAYVIGFYIHQAEVKANAIPYEVKKQEELSKVNHDRNSFLAIYGIEATVYFASSYSHLGINPATENVDWDLFLSFFGVAPSKKQQAKNEWSRIGKVKNTDLCYDAEKLKIIFDS